MAINFGSVSGYDNQIAGFDGPQTRTEDPAIAAKRQEDRMNQSMGVYRKFISDPSITKVSKSYMKNGNPELLSGMGQISFGDKLMSAPNPLLQQIAFTQDVNPTTYNSGSDYWYNRQGFAEGEKTKKAIADIGQQAYTTFDASYGQIDKLNKQFGDQMSSRGTGNGFLNRLHQAQSEMARINQAIQSAQARVNSGSISYSTDSNGRMVGNNNYKTTQEELDKLRSELNQQKGIYDSLDGDTRGGRVRESDSEYGLLNNMWNNYKGTMSPTVANLPISVTYNG